MCCLNEVRFLSNLFTCLNRTNVSSIQIRELDPEIWGGGGGAVFKVRMTRNSFGIKVAHKYKG